ncbi:MAG: trypsin-like serine protease [Planctomycetes bacterium]|nr:trypsin-like serine protease [Planctomycetota bacterium]
MRRVRASLTLAALLLAVLACMPSSMMVGRPSTRATIQRGTRTVRPTTVRPTVVVPTTAPVPTMAPLTGETLDFVRARDMALSNLYATYSGSVVHIIVSTGGRGASATATGTGSGWVWDQNGYIVTNNHVVQGSTRLTVIFPDESQYEAKLIGTDVDSDLAVIQVDASPNSLVPLQLGDSDELQVGQTAVAIGNPFGFAGTMTSGIVSALGRVTVQESGYSLPNLIQTDTSINPGNSGGPLFDITGRVIGVTTMIYSTTGEFSGIGIAVPVNTVKRVVPLLISQGYYEHPYLGVRGWTIRPELADAASLPVDKGALVGEVTPGGPADEAGLRGGTRAVEVPGYGEEGVTVGGDIIVAIDGYPVDGMDDLITRLEVYAVGDEVVLQVIRDDELTDIAVVVGARPAQRTRDLGGG